LADNIAIANLIFAVLAVIFSGWGVYFLYFKDTPKIVIVAFGRDGLHLRGNTVIEANIRFDIYNHGRKAITIEEFVIEINGQIFRPQPQNSRLEDKDKTFAIRKYQQTEKLSAAYVRVPKGRF